MWPSPKKLLPRWRGVFSLLLRGVFSLTRPQITRKVWDPPSDYDAKVRHRLGRLTYVCVIQPRRGVDFRVLVLSSCGSLVHGSGQSACSRLGGSPQGRCYPVSQGRRGKGGYGESEPWLAHKFYHFNLKFSHSLFQNNYRLTRSFKNRPKRSYALPSPSFCQW